MTDGKQLVEGIEGLTSLQHEWWPDLIVLDHHMEELHGLDALNLLRSRGMSIPVIVITAFGDCVTHEWARSLGVTAILGKPFDLRVLRDLALQIVNGR
jgi:CheY-like chemotaxis protein